MKAILLTSNMAWNNDRTDNFNNAIVKEISDLDEEEKETFYPCSLYYEVGARDDTGFETLKIENTSVDGPDGSPIKVFIVTTKMPDGTIFNAMHPDPRSIDTRAHDWATSKFGGEKGDAISFKIDDVKTYNKVNRKEVEKELNSMIGGIRGEEDTAASEFFPVGEGRITGAITGDSQFTPLGANAEEMASEFSVERINPTVVSGSDDVRAEEFGAENIEATDVNLMDRMAMPEGTGSIIGQATPETDFTPFSVSAENCVKCAETFAACGCEDKSAESFFQGVETFEAHVMPLGSGSVTGQATPDTDFTPFGSRAENFAAYDDEISDRQVWKIRKLGGNPSKVSNRSQASDYIKELQGRESGTWEAEQVVPFGVVGRGNDFGQNLAESDFYEAELYNEQVVPFGVVGGGNDFGQNLAEDFGAETIISQDEWEDFYEVQMSGRMNMMYHWNIGKFMADDNYDKAQKWFQEDGNTEDLVIKGAEDFGAESKGMMNMVLGMGLALAAGFGAKMRIDRMDNTEEAPDSEEPSEESEEAPEE